MEPLEQVLNEDFFMNTDKERHAAIRELQEKVNEIIEALDGGEG